tara:strand:- start:1199 stop:3370 length:2172 start_codon:yes stop_codon:yes gene_type:complete
LPRLLNIKTDLSSYKTAQYGYDRRGAGPRNTNASGQPYELENLPTRKFDESDFESSVQNRQFTDFILRGGQLLPETIATDVSRLTKMFKDLKSPNGLLFTAKQNVLSKSGVNVLAVSNSDENSKNRRALNNGLYLPTSTLAQAAVNPLGGHLLKQGTDPTASTGPDGGIFGGILNNLFNLDIQDPLRNPTYFSTVAYNERKGLNEPTSRLIRFANINVNQNTKGENELYNYSGGPNSVLGVGRTSIKMPNDQRTGLNNTVLRDSKFFTTGKTLNTNFGFNYSVFKGGVTNPNFETFRGGTYFGDIYNSGSKTVTGKYSSFTNTPLQNLLGTKNLTFKTVNDKINGAQISLVGQSVYQNGFENNSSVKGLGTTTDYSTIMGLGTENVVTDNNLYNSPTTQDFRTKTPASGSTKSLDYTLSTNRYEGRVNLGEAGKRNTSTSYVVGNSTALDKINALTLYQSENVSNSKERPVNDLCKFRIGVISNDDPNKKTYIHFRAFIDNMSDDYTAEWGAQKFAGRAENLYNYKGFDRKFNLSWTVAAQSKQELIPMYQKLNYLASVCAPDYSDNGYMRGNLIELTVGGYLVNQVGIMTGINYTVPMESPWEIAIPDTQLVNSTGVLSDPSVKELPFMIKVSGFSFIPIHDFVPNVQKNDYFETNQEGKGVLGDLSKFGDEKYIALSNGISGDSYINSQKLKDNENAVAFLTSKEGQELFTNAFSNLSNIV